jgi:hypothetical protein
MATKKVRRCAKCGQLNPKTWHNVKCPGRKLNNTNAATPSSTKIQKKSLPPAAPQVTATIDSSTYNNVFATYRSKVGSETAGVVKFSTPKKSKETPVAKRRHKLDEHRYGSENLYHGKVRISVNRAVKTLSSPVRTVDPQGNPVGTAPFNSRKAGKSLELVALGVANYDRNKHGGVSGVYSPTTKQLARTLLNTPRNDNGAPAYFEYNKSTGGYHYLKPEVKQFLKSVDLDLRTNEKLNIAKLSNA